MREIKYWAFISYSHKDKAWADWFHKNIEGYKIPKEFLNKKIENDMEMPNKLFPVFLDREELSSSQDLNEELKNKLIQSYYLIVICSPSSNKSHWVNQEIKYFKECNDKNKILCVVVDGKPYSSLNDDLDNEFIPDEIRKSDLETHKIILSPDVRKYADGKSNSLIKIISRITNIDYADLNDRERKRLIKKRAILAFIALAFLISIYLVQYYSSIKLEKERDLSQLRLADNLVSRANNLGGTNKLGSAKKLYSQAMNIYAKHNISSIPANLGYALTSENSSNELFKLIGHNDPIIILDTIDDGNKLISCDSLGVAKVWDLKTGVLLNSKKISSSRVLDIKFYAKENEVLFVNNVAEVKKWKLGTNKVQTVFENDELKGLLEYEEKISSAKFFENTEKLVIASVDFSNEPARPDGGTASKRQSILWIIDYKNDVIEKLGLKATIYDVAVSPDGNNIVAGTYDGMAAFKLDSLEEEYFKYLPTIRDPSEHPLIGWVATNKVVISDDGNYVASASSNNVIDIWDLIKHKKLLSRRTFYNGVGSLLFSSEKDDFSFPKLLVGGGKNKIHLIPGYNSYDIVGDLNGVVSLAKDSDKKILVAGGASGNILVWKIEPDLQTTYKISGLHAISPFVDFSYDSNRLLAHDLASNEVKIYNKATGRIVNSINFEEEIYHLKHSIKNDEGFATYWNKGVVDLVSLTDGRILKNLYKSDSNIEYMITSSDRKKILIIDERNDISIVDSILNKSTKIDHGLKNVISVSTNLDSSVLGIASNFEVEIIEKETKVNKISTNKRIAEITLSNDGDLLAVAHTNGEISVYDSRQGSIISTFDAANSTIYGMKFINNGYYLIIATRAGIMSMWQADSGDKVYSVDGIAPIFSLDVSNDGSIAAGVSGDHRIYGEVDVHVWNSQIGYELKKMSSSLKNHTDRITNDSNDSESNLFFSEWYSLQNDCDRAVYFYDLLPTGSKSEDSIYTQKCLLKLRSPS